MNLKFDKESIGWIFFLLGILLFVFFAIEFVFNSTQLNLSSIQPDVWGQFGDIVGGVVGTTFSLVATLLLYVTLKEQRDANLKQNLAQQKQQFESHFFELLKIHRDNVNEITSKGSTGRQVFVNIKDEITSLHEEIRAIYPKDSNILWDLESAKIAYLIVFYGVGNSLEETLKEKIKKICIDPRIQNFLLLKLLRLKQSHERKKDYNAKDYHKKLYLDFDGHQSRLSHYFRHLYQTYVYLNSQPKSFLSYNDKYEYSKRMRAQLSNHEQVILFYNSLIDLGEAWELDSNNQDPNERLITKYDLIRNIPKGFMQHIDAEKVYPDVHYEYKPKGVLTENRSKLEEHYS